MVADIQLEVAALARVDEGLSGGEALDFCSQRVGDRDVVQVGQTLVGIGDVRCHKRAGIVADIEDFQTIDGMVDLAEREILAERPVHETRCRDAVYGVIARPRDVGAREIDFGIIVRLVAVRLVVEHEFAAGAHAERRALEVERIHPFRIEARRLYRLHRIETALVKMEVHLVVIVLRRPFFHEQERAVMGPRLDFRQHFLPRDVVLNREVLERPAGRNGGREDVVAVLARGDQRE